MKYLFIGGYYDGRWIDIVDPCLYDRYYEMPVPPTPIPFIGDMMSDPSSDVFRRERYRLEKIRTSIETHTIFLLDSLTSDDMFSMLMNNYKKV